MKELDDTIKSYLAETRHLIDELKQHPKHYAQTLKFLSMTKDNSRLLGFSPVYNLYKANAFDILKTVGGYDIAALTGICIGGAKYHIPVVLDGAITMAAALVASKLVPGVEDYLIASHMGRECLCKKVSENLGLKPVINGDMALGEGTGAVMMLSLLDNVLEVYNRAANFKDIKIDNYKRLV